MDIVSVDVIVRHSWRAARLEVEKPDRTKSLPKPSFSLGYAVDHLLAERHGFSEYQVLRPAPQVNFGVRRI